MAWFGQFQFTAELFARRRWYSALCCCCESFFLQYSSAFHLFCGHQSMDGSNNNNDEEEEAVNEVFNFGGAASAAPPRNHDRGEDAAVRRRSAAQETTAEEMKEKNPPALASYWEEEKKPPSLTGEKYLGISNNKEGDSHRGTPTTTAAADNDDKGQQEWQQLLWYTSSSIERGLEEIARKLKLRLGAEEEEAVNELFFRLNSWMSLQKDAAAPGASRGGEGEAAAATTKAKNNKFLRSSEKDLAPLKLGLPSEEGREKPIGGNPAHDEEGQQQPSGGGGGSAPKACCGSATVSVDGDDASDETDSSHPTAKTDKIQDNDVVCGRNKLVHAHPGNKQFLKLIQAYRESYQAVTNRASKRQIILRIIEHVHSTGGRFIILDDQDSVDSPFREASFTFRYEKVSHALRSAKPTTGKAFDRTMEQHWLKISGALPNFARASRSLAITEGRQSLELNPRNIHFNDVLLGRGSGSVYHPGNILFRQLCRLSLPSYDVASKFDNQRVAELVINTIHKVLVPPGRFLRMDNDDNNNNNNNNNNNTDDGFIEIPFHDARDKVSQALRDLRGGRKESMSTGILTVSCRPEYVLPLLVLTVSLLAFHKHYVPPTVAYSGPVLRIADDDEGNEDGMDATKYPSSAIREEAYHSLTPSMSFSFKEIAPAPRQELFINLSQERPTIRRTHPSTGVPVTMNQHCSMVSENSEKGSNLHQESPSSAGVKRVGGTTEGERSDRQQRQSPSRATSSCERKKVRKKDGTPIDWIEPDEIGDHDVVLGNGVGSHFGNQRYREICWKNREAYLNSRRNEKVRVAESVIDSVRNLGGRFLEPVIFYDKVRYYSCVSKAHIIDKVCQALGDAKRTHLKPCSEEHFDPTRIQHVLLESPPEDQERRRKNALAVLDKIQIGTRLDIFWPLDNEYYSATVMAQASSPARISLLYDDGVTEWIDLTQHDFEVLSEQRRTKKLRHE
jgi:hypothetical protein